MYLHTMEKKPAYYQILELSDTIKGLSYTRALVSETYSTNGLNRRKTGDKTSFVKDLSFTQVSDGWATGLSDRALLFVAKYIQPSLKMYNLLWHRPVAEKSSEKLILRELVDNKIIFRTEVPGMYIINPLKIWKGTILSCVEATKHLLREHKRPSPELVRDLRPKDDYLLKTGEDYYHQLSDGEFTTNMLEDEGIEYNSPA